MKNLARASLFLLVTLRAAAASSPVEVRPDHVVIVMMENHTYSEIVGSPNAPYMNGILAANGALLTSSHGVEHPSQPNYLDIFSGSNQGVVDDSTPVTIPFSTPNLGARLLAAGFSFATFSESLPSVGFNGDNYTTVGGQNQYQRKHNPAVNWQSADAPASNHLPVSANQPFSAFPTTAAGFAALPTVSIVVPNEQDDMHDGSVAMGDTWLSQNIEAYRAWAATHNSLLIVTFDEDDYSATNLIYTVISGQRILPGQYTEAQIERAPGQGIDHYNILRTIEDLYGLTPCNTASDGSRKSLTDVFVSQAQNVSTRLKVQTGDNVLIGGFIVTGSVPKKVLLRAIGPSLASAGVSGPLADPTLELHKPDGTVVTNDNWKIDDATGASQEAAIRATTLAPTSDQESALLQTLAPGVYSAIVAGKNNTTGVGLVEAYDVDASAPAQLANLSTRGFVNSGDNVMIGGFIVGPTGNASSTLVLRAIGPSLAAYGVPNPLQDPVLELHDANGGSFTDDDWQSDPNAAKIPASLQPTDTRESATYQTLVPGAYTAIVHGKGGATGVALVEVYNLQ